MDKEIGKKLDTDALLDRYLQKTTADERWARLTEDQRRFLQDFDYEFKYILEAD